MAQFQIAYLLRSGTQERWRRLCQDVAELRLNQFAGFCKCAGITQVQIRLFHLLHGELLLLSVQTQESQQSLKELASSLGQWDSWLREQLRVLLGWDVQEMLTDPLSDLIFAWEGIPL